MIKIHLQRALAYSTLVFASTLLMACGGSGFTGSGSGPGASGDLVLTELSQSAAQPAVVAVTFKVQTRLGEPVANLAIDNFTIEENGDRISVFEAQPSIDKDPEDFVYNTLLLLDLSGSVLASSFETLKEATAAFIDASIDDTDPDAQNFHIKLAYFDGRQNIIELTEYTSSKQTLNAALDALTSDVSQDSSTNLYGAVVEGVDDLDIVVEASNVDGVVSAGSLVIFTDGNDQAARITQQTAQEAVDTASNNLSIFTIGLQGEVDLNVLAQLGRDGTSFADDISGLVAAFDEIATRISNQANSIYVFRYCSPKRSGEDNQLTLRATREGESGELTTEFSAVGFTGGCVL